MSVELWLARFFLLVVMCLEQPAACPLSARHDGVGFWVRFLRSEIGCVLFFF